MAASRYVAVERSDMREVRPLASLAVKTAGAEQEAYLAELEQLLLNMDMLKLSAAVRLSVDEGTLQLTAVEVGS